jgi:uncharacterized protein YcnI
MPTRTAPPTLRRSGAVAIATLLAFAASALFALPAQAHVTVQAPGATQGGYTKLTFRAPTERPAATTKIEVQFPAEQPIVSVNVKPKAGWVYTVKKGAPAVPVESRGEPVKEVVQTITWTVAAGNPGIKAGEFEEFEVSGGPMPKVAQISFKALQTYANGEVVRWIAERQEGQPEPETPAPVLKLAPAETAQTTTAAAASTTPAGGGDDDGGSNALSIAALIASLIALGLGAFALMRGRRPATA